MLPLNIFSDIWQSWGSKCLSESESGYIYSLLLSCLAVLEVQFDKVGDSIKEGSQVSLTAVLTFPADRDVTVDISTNEGSAIGKFLVVKLCTASSFHYPSMQLMITVYWAVGPSPSQLERM